MKPKCELIENWTSFYSSYLQEEDNFNLLNQIAGYLLSLLFSYIVCWLDGY